MTSFRRRIARLIDPSVDRPRAKDGKRTAQSGPRPAPPNPDGHQRVIAVLGMHRSGTSNLAGSLEDAGLNLGPVAQQGQWNPKGNRENRELMKIHEDVLLNSGGAWHTPPERIRWSAEHKTLLRDHIASRSHEPMWGFKDPRAILLLEGWLEELPELEMVATLRHPMAVARSLQHRHGTEDLDRWLGLWLAYDLPLLELCREREVPLIDFDLPAERYLARLEAIVTSLGLTAPARDDGFFDASMRHQQAPDDTALPDEVRRVYDELRGIAETQAAA